MKTKWRLYIVWSVLSLGLLGSSVDAYRSPFTRRKQVFKRGARISKRASVVSPGFMRPADPGAGIRSGFAPLQDVSVTCSASDLVVRVKPGFYGQGAHADELKLGSTCTSNGVLGPNGDLLFTYPLTACDAVRQSHRRFLVYKYVLHFVPSTKRIPTRAQRIDVDIECRYHRDHHVYQLTLQPTWKTTVVSKTLKGRGKEFQIQLMDDSWSSPASSQVYQLGNDINIQVSASHPPTGGKLYINSCYATPLTDPESALKYSIIGNFGCMSDSKTEPGSSQFISRSDATLRFSLKAFQFTSDPDTEVTVHCRLFITSEAPGPAQKSCTYRGNSWKALSGDDSICDCCDSQCVTSKSRRAMTEGSASSRPLLVSDQPYTADDGFLPVSRSSVSMSPENKASLSHGNTWGRVDVVMYDEEEQFEEDEEGWVNLGGMKEGDLKEINESEGTNYNQLEMDGSGYLVQGEFSESEEDEEEEEGAFGGSEDELTHVEQAIHLNETEGEVSEGMLPSGADLQGEIQLLDSEEEEETRKHAGGAEEEEEEEDDEDLVDDGEMSWYFTWR